MYNEWMEKTLKACLLAKIEARCTRKKRTRTLAVENVPAIGTRLQGMMEEFTEV